jgi:hypothetical protein
VLLLLLLLLQMFPFYKIHFEELHKVGNDII